MPSYPIWSTGINDGEGDPTSPVWNPAVTDTTLQDGDHWFYTPGDSIRDLATLIQVYHASVGQNTLLELDFAIDRTGNVDPTHAAAYASLGSWIRSCYGTPLSATSGIGSVFVVELGGAAGATMDRVMIQEDTRQGELVRAYTIEYQAPGSSTWTAFSTGTAVGHKRIDLGSGSAVVASRVRLTVTQAVGTPVVSFFGAFAPCPSG